MCCSSGDLVRQIRLGARLSVVGVSVGVMSVQVSVGISDGDGVSPSHHEDLNCASTHPSSIPE